MSFMDQRWTNQNKSKYITNNQVQTFNKKISICYKKNTIQESKRRLT